MALFDFLKKKKEIEKNVEKSRASSASKAAESSRSVLGASSQATVPVAPTAVLVAPHITEKSAAAAALGNYTFRVEDNATSMRVKEAIEKTYHVHVRDVHLIALPAKPRRRGLTRGHTAGYKKAIVSLKKGEHIDLF